nr:dTDP-4-dehydrorhamnose 3,5-epimerase [uncultured Catonella sp.]
MNKIATGIEGLFVIEPQIFGDHRGWFMESWSKKKFEEMDIDCEFLQDNHSFSAKKGTLRGLHFQKGEYSQAKLVRVLRGRVYDVAVDLRKSSSTFLKWYGTELNEENKKQMFIPRGFAHGFLTLTDNVEFAYKADNYYNKESEEAIRFDDDKVGVDWKLADFGIKEVIVSDKDKIAPSLEALTKDCFF